ncbi:MAG: helix-turn-helix domain-containing protein [Ignavibacteriales bacterium]|nr:helix-turn-helix domain-containing protein [Ignavibacteriales bacterium]
MSQLIDFSNFSLKKEIPASRLRTANNEALTQACDISEDEYRLTINILVHNNLNKITFTIDEVAAQLGVSREFIRRRVKAGKIKAIYHGDKPAIHITELARLLTEGIK